MRIPLYCGYRVGNAKLLAIRGHLIAASRWPRVVSDFDRHEWFMREVILQEGQLRAVLRRFFPTPIDLSDGIQETYVRLLGLSDEQLVGIRSPSAFLFSVGRNIAIEWARRRRLMPQVTSPAYLAAELPDEGPSALDELSRRQERELMWKAIAALPERCRRVLVLRKLEGLSQKDIAIQLGISENTVEKHAASGTKLCARYCSARGRSIPSAEKSRPKL